MNINLLELITLFSSLLLFLLGSIFLFYPFGKKLSNYLLAAFIIVNAILLTNFFLLIKFSAYSSRFPFIDHIGQHSYLILAPLIYFYIRSLCNPDFRLSVKSAFHLLPYLLVTGFSFVIIFLARNPETNFPGIWQLFHIIYKIVLYFQIAFYMIFSFIELKKYRSQLKEFYSSLIKIDLMWVNLVLYFFIFMWLTDMSIFFLNIFKLISPQFSYYLVCQSISTDLILSVSLIYKGMRQTTLPAGIVSVPKYNLSKQDISIYEENKKLLNQYMKAEKPYLLPELSLEDLAKMIKIPSKLLSQTINYCYKQNFNNYINQYRIDEAKRIIENDKNDKKTVFEILLDSGFNSKSVFNESFKKFNGYTPKEYRVKLKKLGTES